jgi:hypothetical protein
LDRGVDDPLGLLDEIGRNVEIERWSGHK